MLAKFLSSFFIVRCILVCLQAFKIHIHIYSIYIYIYKVMSFSEGSPIRDVCKPHAAMMNSLVKQSKLVCFACSHSATHTHNHMCMCLYTVCP